MIYFIADIHLSAEKPEITLAFERFIFYCQRQEKLESLYILGDLFDYYLGDDLIDDFQIKIAELIAQLKIPVYFIIGNRDFLIGKRFLQLSKMIKLPDRLILNLGEKRLILEHGDLLCLNDIGYQKMRKILHNPFLQKIYYLLPKWLKKRLAKKLRGASKGKMAKLTDVHEDFVKKIMLENQASILIHGHTHRPNIHEYDFGKRFVLSDWQPSAPILCYHSDNLTLLNSCQWSASC